MAYCKLERGFATPQLITEEVYTHPKVPEFDSSSKQQDDFSNVFAYLRFPSILAS